MSGVRGVAAGVSAAGGRLPSARARKSAEARSGSARSALSSAIPLGSDEEVAA